MTKQLGDWKRPHFAPGGGTPFLFYVVYGDVDLDAALSRQAYRSEGIAEGLDLFSYNSTKHQETLDSFREGLLWQEFAASHGDIAVAVAAADHCLVLRGEPSCAENLNYLRDSVGLLTHQLDQGGLAIYDPQMFRWWSPSAWREDIFEPAAAVPQQHVVILVSPEEQPGRSWFHTRGMRKFGRPDISVHDVTLERRKDVVELCNRMIEFQAFGGVVPDGEEISMANLPSGGIARHGGHLEDPDFNNLHLEIAWPSANGRG